MKFFLKFNLYKKNQQINKKKISKVSKFVRLCWNLRNNMQKKKYVAVKQTEKTTELNWILYCFYKLCLKTNIHK